MASEDEEARRPGAGGGGGHPPRYEAGYDDRGARYDRDYDARPAAPRPRSPSPAPAAVAPAQTGALSAHGLSHRQFLVLPSKPQSSVRAGTCVSKLLNRSFLVSSCRCRAASRQPGALVQPQPLAAPEPAQPSAAQGARLRPRRCPGGIPCARHAALHRWAFFPVALLIPAPSCYNESFLALPTCLQAASTMGDNVN